MSPSPVVEIVRALGSWDLNLTDRAPQHIVDQLLAGRFGHIAVDAARENPEVLGDALLSSARYVGVLRGSSHEGGRLALKGSGLAFWLGAADGVGDVHETAKAFAGATFAATITGLLPPGGAVTAGTITTPAGATLYTGTHRYQTPRAAIDYVCDLFGCDWRVNGNGTLDAGKPDVLFVSDPQAAVIRRADGYDMGLRALPGQARLDSDVEDFSTRVVTLAEGEGTTIAVGTANIAVNPYVDLRANPVKLTRLVSESNTSATNANARAALALQQYTAPRDQVSLSTDTHDIRGNVAAGDSVWVYDPDAGLVDNANEITFRGDRISPVKLRVFQVSWPVEQGMGVYFRSPAGVWVDLTDYVEFEADQTNLTVGGYDRPLASSGESLSFRPYIKADASVPGVPAFVTPFDQAIYTTGTTGLARAQVKVAWSGPATNTDGTAFADGAHFEVRYRISPPTSSTWAQAAAKTWGTLATWANPVPVGTADWEVAYAPADATSTLIQELTPGTPYDFQIRAIDGANPPNAGAWSSMHTLTLGDDTIPPQPPAAPIVAASLVQVSVRHTLGLASGGTYNLPLDLAYLEVHIGGTSTFTPDATTRVGKIIATRAQINGAIPVVGTFPVATTAQVWVKVIAVDTAGNQSDPSAGAAVTATLIDSQWVADLTADKITAGSFTASYGITGLLRTAPTGARFEAGVNGALNGFRLYRPSGTLALSGEAATGDLKLFGTDGTTATLTFTASTGLIDMRGKLTSGAGVGAGATVVVDPASPPAIRMYPIGTLDRFEMIARTGARPGGATAAGFELRGLDASGQPNGLSLEAWSTNVWLHQKRTNGTQIGGAVKLQQTGEAFLTNENDTRYVVATASQVQVIVPGSNATFNNGVSIVSSNSVDITGSNGVFAYGGGASKVELRADGSALFGGNANGYVSVSSTGTAQLVSSGVVKSFIIDHPSGDPDRLLVHACTESPQAGVEYWGEATITAGEAIVDLPDYFEALTEVEGRQVQATVIHTGQTVPVLAPPPPRPPGTSWAEAPPAVRELPLAPVPVAATVPTDGRFAIKCLGPDGTRVAWLVKAVRRGAGFPVEPLRSEVSVAGDGPYRYLAPAA